jgi:hypothetical protein
VRVNFSLTGLMLRWMASTIWFSILLTGQDSLSTYLHKVEKADLPN